MTRYVWRPGDGATITKTRAFAYTYTSGGRYASQLTVSNASGSDTAYQFITVGDWGDALAKGQAFSKKFTSEGRYPVMDATTGKMGEVRVLPASGTLSMLATLTITVTQDGFLPDVAEAFVGDTVRWVFATSGVHHVLSWGR